jgi:hypothetical protein
MQVNFQNCGISNIVLSWFKGVTIDRVWIGYWIYWPLEYTTWNYTLQSLTQTSVLSLLQFPLAVSCQWLLQRRFFSFLHSGPLVIATHAELFVNWQLNWLGPRLAAISHQPPSLLFTGWLPTDNWTLSLTNQLLHITSLNLTYDNSLQLKVKVMLRPTVQLASPSWNEAPIWGLRPDLYYCQTVAGLLIWGALSVERMGLSGRCPCYITSGQTQQKTPPPTILLFLSWRTPSDRLNIISARTCYRAMHVPSRDCCIAMVLHITLLPP